MHPDYRLLIDGETSGQFDRLCALLAEIEQRGSLRRATEELGLSYRYAWGLIRRAEERLGTSLLISTVGGASGGGAELTPAAHELLHRHRLLRQEVKSILGPGRPPEPPDDERTTTNANRPLLMASTIGPVEVGLVDALVTAYRAETGIWIRYIAAGTGQALEVARTGRVDLVLVHAPELEERFIAEGFGTGRHLLAANTFLLCGPSEDPAEIRSAESAIDALRRIAKAEAPFVSRGDQSGTHVKEVGLWREAGIEPAAPWYQVWPLGGQGNAPTLRHAAAVGAYTLIDSATFAMIAPEGYAPLFQGAPLLSNLFCLIPVNPERFTTVNYAGAERFVAWTTGPKGEEVIRSFGLSTYGRPLFEVPSRN